MSKQPVIKMGDPQPLECPNCEDFYGYQVSDLMRTQYTTRFNPDGSPDGGFYSEYQPIIHEGKTAECQNCGSRLPFKVSR